MMTTQELVDWARNCHPNISIHAYDATWWKLIKHISLLVKPSVCRILHQRPSSAKRPALFTTTFEFLRWSLTRDSTV